MSEPEFTIELNTNDRPNRFQVDPVEYRRKQPEVDTEGEADEDDTFPEADTNITSKRKSSRLSNIRSSLRDKDKTGKFKDMQTTRFQTVPAQDGSDVDERESLIDEYDQNARRSFLHFTREALPRLDNYRDILSVQAVYRPTLDDLHNASISNKATVPNIDPEADNDSGLIKFGWIKGVLMRCILNIWGVMLFLRLSWVVAQAGVIEGSILILTTTVVTTITAISMSAISTNGVIKGGGTYYMISRSLGPEFGGSIGLIFALANAVACAMYVVGFCESMNALLASFGIKIIDGAVQDVRVIGCVTMLILTIIVVVGMEWEAKAQVVLLIILLGAICDFFIGSLLGPKNSVEYARGFTGYNATVLEKNLWRDYRQYDGVEHNFFSVLAIFFPAATGILAGANISGDLKDPSSSIPKGTILAIIITSITYIGMAFAVGATVVRDATGNLTDIVNGSTAFLDCVPGQCNYGIHNSFQVIELVSLFGPLIYAGCFAATLSSALASLVSAPKVFQALCKDKLYPKIEWFAKGYGPNNEPVRGYVLTFILAIAFILVGELNAIAPLISNFFLGAYMLVNFSTFHASLAKPVGWRPTFKYYNMWLSLIGSILCVATMFLISWTTALLTYATLMALYLIVSYRKPDVNWGSTTQAQTYKNALLSVQQLNSIDEHVKNFRPQILVLSSIPSTRPILVHFANLFTKNLSLLVCGHVIKGSTSQRQRTFLQHQSRDWMKKHKVKGFYSLVDGDDFETASRALMQASGVGKLKPNILLMGYKNDWQSCNHAELLNYFNTLHNALDMHLAVAILRVEKGLDYSKVLGDDVPVVFNEPRPIITNDSSADLLANDKNSNLNGSSDSLSRNVSQATNGKVKQANKASSTSDLSIMTGNGQLGISQFPDGKNDDLANYLRKTNKRTNERAPLYTAPGGGELPKHVLQELTQFTKKRSKSVIDVYWLYDDGGLTLLLPYLISTRRNWGACKLRVFALVNKKDEIELEMSSMASLLAKFRIDYSDLELISDITRKADDSTYKYFNDLIRPFVRKDQTDDTNEVTITDSELLAVKDKTNRYLRLREHLIKNSMSSDLIVMTLPMPRKNVVSAPLYMAWLESLSRGLPPFLFVRGNQTSVLTFYS